ncbi:MAG: hypothetical protein ACYC8T_06485 [Myxococcaceae bacterium]
MSRLTGLSFLSRRRVLSLALGAGGLVAGGAGGLFALRGQAPGVSGLRCLSDHQYRTLSALAMAAFPEGGPFPAGAASMDLARAFDGYLADEPAWARKDLGSALLLLEHGPVLFERRLKTFSHLSPEERLSHFERWGQSETALRRQVAVGLKKFLSLVFYDRPEVWPSIGYDGPMTGDSP